MIVSAPDGAEVTTTDLTIAAQDGTTLAGPVSMQLVAGTVTALVAPSGGGKSLVCRSLVGDLPKGLIHTGSATVNGVDIGSLDRRGWRTVRRTHVSLVGQDPGSQLAPHAKVGKLLRELAHPGAPGASQVLAMMDLDPELAGRRVWQLSGGQQRRIALARAVTRLNPVLIVDEPLAGLHDQLRRRIADTIRRLAVDRSMAVLVTVHTADAAKQFTDRIVALPRAIAPPPVSTSVSTTTESGGRVVLRIRDLEVSLGGRAILHGVDLACEAGRAVALMGESGSGKTTLARALTGQTVASAGQLQLGERRIDQPLRRRKRDDRLAIQLIPQNPLATLNPSRTVAATLERSLRMHLAHFHASELVSDLLIRVGLSADFADRYPHMLSGGQRQRVAIARALACSPEVLVCDEITSALDPVASGLVMAVLQKEMVQRGLAVLFITHDLALAETSCSSIYRLEDGRLVPHHR